MALEVMILSVIGGITEGRVIRGMHGWSKRRCGYRGIVPFLDSAAEDAVGGFGDHFLEEPRAGILTVAGGFHFWRGGSDSGYFPVLPLSP